MIAPLLVAASLLSACSEPACDSDNGGPGCDEPCTGFGCGTYDTAGVMFIAGAAEVDDDVFVGGHLGFLFTKFDGDVLCSDLGDWVSVGDAPEGCPQCDWSFTLEVENTRAIGDWCDDAGLVGGEWDGFRGGFGFSATYVGYYETYQNIVWYYYGGDNNGYYASQWLPLAYQDGYVSDVAGTAGDHEWLLFIGYYGFDP